ncbi:hypothetical protein AGMMS49992_24650 [Clostridia bacterium]|nr:hypothetical protein AGMMS49992_24650 [Clostridia bacterium]
MNDIKNNQQPGDSNKEHKISWKLAANIASVVAIVISIVALIETNKLAKYQMDKSYEPYIVVQSETTTHHWVVGEKSGTMFGTSLKLLNVGSGVAMQVKGKFDYSALEEYLETLKTVTGSTYDILRGKLDNDDSDDTLVLDTEKYHNTLEGSSIFHKDSAFVELAFLQSGPEYQASIALPWFFILTINHMFENETIMSTYKKVIEATPIYLDITYKDLLNNYYDFRIKLNVEVVLFSPLGNQGTAAYKVIMTEIKERNGFE